MRPKIVLSHNKQGKLIMIVNNNQGVFISQPTTAKHLADSLGISVASWYRGIREAKRKGVIKVLD